MNRTEKYQVYMHKISYDLHLSAAGVVTSTLYKKLKFIMNNKMIVINCEEGILVNHLTSFRYIDIEGEITETPFITLEVVNVLTVQEMLEPSKLELSMASWKGSKAIIETENAQGWGKLIEVHEKKDTFGLGYEPSLVKAIDQSDNKQIPSVTETFTSASHIFDGKVPIISDEAYIEVASSWIRQAEPDEELKNWKTMKIP